MRSPVSAGPGLRETIRRDALRFLDPHCRKRLTVRRLALLGISPEFRLVVQFRVYSWLGDRGMRSLAYFLYAGARSRTACDLALGARIGPGMRIEHRTDVVVGPYAVIGEDVYLFNGVTIGKRRPLEDDAMATIGDRVMLGSGAKILGGVHVGSDAVVGANAVVVADVPAGATVAGNPARVVGTTAAGRR
jgi:serine O-acetyltransferase